MPLSQEHIEKSRKYESLIFHRITHTGQVHIADALKTSDASVSRLKDKLPELTKMLAFCGLKVVPQEFKCYDPKDIEPYIQLAKQHMRGLGGAEELQWSD